MARPAIRFCLIVGIAAGVAAFGTLPGFAQGYVPDYRTIVTLHEFGANEPGIPTAGVVFDKAGNLYGTESGGLSGSPGAVYELTPPPAGAPYKGWKETVLYTFAGGADGASPNGQLLVDASGNLFGATSIGGGACSKAFSYGCGVIFELSPPAHGHTQWTETVLYRFTNGIDGAFPSGSLIADSAGNLYGTTYQGGSNSCNIGYGCGTVFQLSPPPAGQTGWSFKVLYASTTDSITGGLVFDSVGNLFGVTGSTAFELSPPAGPQTSWTETQIASFGDYQAIAGMTFGPDGSLYGFHLGQPYPLGDGVGDIYQLSPPAGNGTRWPLQFIARLNGSDGAQPAGVPTFDRNGNIYGVAANGGHEHNGTVFEIVPGGTIYVLYKFNDGGRVGSAPQSTLTLDAAGNIYGANSDGGPNAKGSVWEILAH